MSRADHRVADDRAERARIVNGERCAAEVVRPSAPSFARAIRSLIARATPVIDKASWTAGTITPSSSPTATPTLMALWRAMALGSERRVRIRMGSEGRGGGCHRVGQERQRNTFRPLE